MSYWETLFDKGRIWGSEPCTSAIIIAYFFKKYGIKKVLIPGIGYARNAPPFLRKGISIVGIEISNSAIELAKESGCNSIIHRGSVLHMPFDDTKYDGIFCYSLLHLFNKYERHKIIESLYNQLVNHGYMFCVVVSTKAEMYGRGRLLSKNRYEITKDLKVFFYDNSSVISEFINFGLVEFYQFDEPIKHIKNEPHLKCYIVKCQKNKLIKKNDLSPNM